MKDSFSIRCIVYDVNGKFVQSPYPAEVAEAVGKAITEWLKISDRKTQSEIMTQGLYWIYIRGELTNETQI